MGLNRGVIMQQYSTDSDLGAKVVMREFSQYQKRRAQLGYDGEYTDERIQELSQEISTIEQPKRVAAAIDVSHQPKFAAKVQAILDPRKYDNNKFWSIMYSKGLGDRNFDGLDFKNGREIPSELHGYKLGASQDDRVHYFACWPNIGDVIQLLSSKAAVTEIINACALNNEYKLSEGSSFGSNDPTGPTGPTGPNGPNGPHDPVVPGLYGNHYSFDNGLIPAVHETTRLDSVFFLKLAAVLSTLGVAGLIVACTVLSGQAMVVLAALGGLSTLAGIGFFAKSQFPSAPAPVVQNAV